MIKKAFIYVVLTIALSPLLWAQNVEVRCVEGDCINGYGILEYVKTGTTLEAYFTNGEFSYGILRYKDGRYYKGHFVNERYEGLGCLYTKESGEFVFHIGMFKYDALVNGYIFNNVTVTQVKGGKPVTKENLLNLSPALAEGRVSGKLLEGDGKNGPSVWLFPDSSSFYFNAKEGGYYHARLEWPEASSYTGEFNNTIPHGLGVIKEDSTLCKIGLFRNGRIVEGYISQNDTISIYKPLISLEDELKKQQIKEKLEQRLIEDHVQRDTSSTK